MSYKELLQIGSLVILIGIVGLFAYTNPSRESGVDTLDPTPQQVTLSGTYACLPYLDTTVPQTKECVFGLLTDDGVYYMVNFGASSNAMEQFQNGEHITAEGFTIIKEALSTDQWADYNMKGIFTITKMISSGAPVQGKLDISAVCDGALAYMTFSDGVSAEKFVVECKEGKHPEVIEKFLEDMNLGDGATI